MIKLVEDTIDRNDIDALCNWLDTYPRLTKGPLTVDFEEQWSEWLEREYSVFVNSGSSAILLMFAALKEVGMLHDEDKVVVPALSWITDLTSVTQLGLTPILCDCNMQDLAVDIYHLEEIFKKEKPKALLLVSVLGLAPDMHDIMELCEQYDVILLEDVCESVGTTYNNEKLGTFGLMSCFSMYFGHHISSIEGGIVSTNDPYLYNILKALRSHGWSRDLDLEFKDALQKEWNVDDFNEMFTFYYEGFNLRNTDLQAFLALRQLDKLPKFISKRQSNFQFYLENIENDFWWPAIVPNNWNVVSNFAFPIIHPNKLKVVETCQQNEIEIRPLICGSMGTQPIYVKKFGTKILKNSSIIDRCGLYIPNHPFLSGAELDFIVETVNKAIK